MSDELVAAAQHQQTGTTDRSPLDDRRDSVKDGQRKAEPIARRKALLQHALIDPFMKHMKAPAGDLAQRCAHRARADLVIPLSPVRNGLRVQEDIRKAPCFST
ncbi:hypothetical protein [Paraburkholderia dipogonis]|uniref:hypothetical protein n=1 Tax=Paraburkholderia dipogonis TaxID=1211383 RepID=UPI001FCAB197|nr:hypothetical protein [Paraburkholderia dipogonis]